MYDDLGHELHLSIKVISYIIGGKLGGSTRFANW